jgi:Adenylate and Guanylate cyclase catalytic domain
MLLTDCVIVNSRLFSHLICLSSSYIQHGYLHINKHSAIRVGIHSGPVTAGVLRGDRSRFQLFGDTMNTASRMEQTGSMNMIQISQATATILEAAGKSHWFKPRDRLIEAKGKGLMQTYWASLSSGGSDCSHRVSNKSSNLSSEEKKVESLEIVRNLMTDKTMRLIDWNVDILQRLLRQIVAQRPDKPESWSVEPFAGLMSQTTGQIALDEVVEIIALPDFNAKSLKQHHNPDEVVLPDYVVDQLHKYVTGIAAMYVWHFDDHMALYLHLPL